MTHAERLRLARDRALIDYLTVKRAGGISKPKLRKLQFATLNWWRETKGKTK